MLAASSRTRASLERARMESGPSHNRRRASFDRANGPPHNARRACLDRANAPCGNGQTASFDTTNGPSDSHALLDCTGHWASLRLTNAPLLLMGRAYSEPEMEPARGR